MVLDNKYKGDIKYSDYGKSPGVVDIGVRGWFCVFEEEIRRWL